MPYLDHRYVLMSLTIKLQTSEFLAVFQMLQLSNTQHGDSSVSGDHRRGSERRMSGKRTSAVFLLSSNDGGS